MTIVYNPMALPFKVGKHHKSNTLFNWRKKPIVHPNLDALYEMYIRTANCNVCNKVFKNSQDRALDHDHKTGKFRYILCRCCNLKMDRKTNSNNLLGLKNIGYYKDNYYVKIYRNGKYVFNKKRKNLEDAVELRDEFLKSEAVFNENLKSKEENLNLVDIQKKCLLAHYVATNAKSMSLSSPTAQPAKEFVE